MKTSTAPLDHLLQLIPIEHQRKALELVNQIADSEYRELCQKKLFVDTQANKDIVKTFKVVCNCIRTEFNVGDFENAKNKQKLVVFSRQIAAYFILLEFRRVPGCGLARVGRLYNPPKNHATIVHSRKVVENYYFTDREMEEKLDNVAKCLDRIGINQPFNRLKQLKKNKNEQKAKRQAL